MPGQTATKAKAKKKVVRKKKVKKTEPEAPTREALVAAAKDLTRVMKLKPAIKVAKTITDEALTKNIIEEANEIDPELDSFQQGTIDVLVALGVDVEGIEVAESLDAQKKKQAEKTQAKKQSRGKAKDRIAFMAELVKKGTMTRKEIIEEAAKEFPEVSTATLGTYLSDGSNPKYCQFPKLIVKDSEGCLCFEK